MPAQHLIRQTTAQFFAPLSQTRYNIRVLYRYRVLGLLFLLSIITYLDRVCISVAGPRMQADLGIDPTGWGWVVGAFTLSYAAFEIPSGAWGDRYGPRKVLTRIVLWWSLFTTLTGAVSVISGALSVFTGAVSTFAVLLAVRFFFGAGEAGAYPNSASAISKWFPTHERARATGTVWMASRIGGALTPLIVVPIQVAFGWRATFYCFGILGLIWCCVWYWWYRDYPFEKQGVTKVEMDEIGAGTTREHHSLPWAKVLRKRNFWTILLMYHTYCWGSYFYLSWLHTYLQKGRGFTENEMRYLSPLPFIAGACGNFFGGWLSDRLVKSHGLKFGRGIVGTCGLAMAGFFLMSAAFVPGKLPAVICLALGYGSMDCMLPVAWAICLDVGRKYGGAVSGSMNMAGQMGSFLSSVTFGYMVAYFGNYNDPLKPLAFMLFVSAFIFWQINPNEQLVTGDT